MAKRKLKKIWKIGGIVFLGILVLLIAVPFFLEAKIADIVKSKANQNMNATLDFEDAKLSLIKSFPSAHVKLSGLALVNKAPFEGDTLFSADDIQLELAIKELFKSAEDPIGIKKFQVDGAKLHIKVDAEENANYDIALEATTDTTPSPSNADTDGFTLALQDYSITNTAIVYDDFASGMHLEVLEMNHSGSGDLSLATSQLQTKTDALVSFTLDSTQYLNKNKLALDALIGIDLTKNKYSFLENKALVNQLPLVFDGFVQLNEEDQEVDISFKTPSSDFKNFLAVIPEAYASNLDGVTTTGNFEVEGQFKGKVDDTHIPSFAININSDNASFKYPDLPKTVRQVFIDTEIKNETGIAADTYVTIERLSFRIDEDVFNLSAKIRELLGNTKVNLNADGRINLANIAQAYPVPEDYGLQGILNADISTAFDMTSIEQQQYQNTSTMGTASLSGFHYESEELKHPVDITEAAVRFNPSTVSLEAFSGKTGQTDFQATGTLDNLLGYAFNDENLKGNFQLQSNRLVLDDFMVEETAEESASDAEKEEPQEKAERIQIPSFLEATVAATANTVQYDNLNLQHVAGQLLIKDQTATLKDVSADLFDGRITLNGDVNTKEAVSTFAMDLGMENFKIAESFQALDLFKVVAPVAQALQGRLNSNIKFSGNLKEDLTPNLATLTGDLLGELLSTKVNTQKAPALAALSNQFDFIDLTALDLKDLKAVLAFNEGKVATQPFTVNYKDITITIAGNHSFDALLDYKATLEVPAKYLGEEVNQLIAQIDDDSLKDLTVPVIASIGGPYTSPKVSTDLTAGVKKLTAQLINIQKQKLLNQGKDKAKDLIGDLLGGDAKDSTATKSSGVTDVLGGLLGKKKDSTSQDSTAKNDAVKDAAKSVLGGLFKKKKDTTKKD